MREQRLSFSQLEEESVILKREQLRDIIGGVTPAPPSTLTDYLSSQLQMTVMSGIDSDGNWVCSVDGGNTWMQLVFQLDAVTIIGHGSYSRPGYFTSSYDGFGATWADFYGAVYGINGGGNGTPSTFTFELITIPDTLKDIAESIFEDLAASPTFTAFGHLNSAYEIFIVFGDPNMSKAEFSYKVAVIGAGAYSIRAQLGIQGYVEFADIMAKAYMQADSFTRQWFHDKMNPTDPNAFFSEIPQEVRDEWEAAANN